VGSEIKAKAFINYRSEDTGETASRLYRELSRKLLPEQLFLDHERIDGGAAWPEQLRLEVGQSSVMLVLIGKRWLTAQAPETGDRRLNLPDDWVRLEIEFALSHGKLLIPLLIDETEPLPKRALQTVPSIAVLSELQCLRLRRKDWDFDIQQLIGLLQKHGFEPLQDPPKREEASCPQIDPCVISRYRERLSPMYARWDLSPVGVAQSGGSRPAIDVELDDIYLPLRLGRGYDADELQRGLTLSPFGLLVRGRPLIIRGNAGSGKTTWLRWTFRRLLADEGAFPMLIELRRLGSSWGAPKLPSDQRSIEAYLEDLLMEHAGAEWHNTLATFLGSSSEIRPVLLVDGWDELGPLGEEVRSKLMRFMKDYPRVQTVVTSRPYGEGRPSASENFEILDIQPLSDEEIKIFASCFYTRCYGADQQSSAEQTRDFLYSLSRSQDATSLARTALFLTMMLLISRSSPLPDKRHLLYQKCVENLLTALPERKRERGVLITSEQWRPEDSEETFRLASQLAFQMQEAGYQDRSMIIRPRQEVKALLSEAWGDEKRERFLNWLCGPAALLVDRADGSLSFAHLSFQEYLAAWYLYSTVEGTEERKKVCKAKLSTYSWWETLRLWSALVGGQRPEKLTPVFEELLSEEDGLCLVGAMFADGIGDDEQFIRWVVQFVTLVTTTWPRRFEDTRRAWSVSRQDDRRRAIGLQLRKVAVKAKWQEWLRFRELSLSMNLEVAIPLPIGSLTSNLLITAAYSKLTNGKQLALGRLLCCGSPFWPGDPKEVSLLQVWPSPRLLYGFRLQVLASLGATRSEITCAANLLDKVDPLVERQRSAAFGAALDKTDPIVNGTSEVVLLVWNVIAGQLRTLLDSYDKISDFASDWVTYWLRGSMESVTDRNRWSYIAGAAELWAAGDYLRRDYLGTPWARECAHGWLSAMGKAPAVLGVSALRPFDKVENVLAALGGLAHGPMAVRALLAHVEPMSSDVRMALIALACKASLHPEASPRGLKRAIGSYPEQADPLWPALARHLADRSTINDVHLLESVARDPTQRDGPLSWGLQYIVRGDVVLDDGSELTLDSIWSDLGRPAPPLLLDQPSILN